MNAGRLLAHYDRVADSPDAVSRLRRFVLDLAVRGRLVEQDPADEPASELLKSIAKVKEQLGVKHQVAPLAAEEVPFHLPAGWHWSRIGELCTKTGSGSTPRGGKNAYSQIGIPFFRSQNVYNDGLRLDDVAYIGSDIHARMAGTTVQARDLLLNITGGSMGRCCRIPDEFSEGNISQHVAIIRPTISKMTDYLHKLVLSPYFQAFIFDEQTGAGRGGLPKHKMDRIAVAVPPICEQRRIVAKVNELMTLCDQLEETRTKREETRDRLAKASHARLSAPDTDTEAFRANARFAINVLPQLSARADQVKHLRQTILNLAVRGRLVEQVAADEPALELLTRIKAEKVRLVKLGKLNRRKLTETAPRNGMGFPLRAGWEVATIADVLIELQTGPFGSSLHQRDYEIGGTPVINPKSIQGGTIVPIEKMAVGANTLKRLSTFKVQTGDIVMARRGEMGRCAVVTEKEDGWLCGTGSLILRLPADLCAEYLALLIGSPHAREYLSGSSVGATMQNLNQSILLGMSICVPPLAEQHRIITKIDALMTLCDRLEANLGTAETGRIRLLESLIRDALLCTGREIQFAEPTPMMAEQ